MMVIFESRITGDTCVIYQHINVTAFQLHQDGLVAASWSVDWFQKGEIAGIHAFFVFNPVLWVKNVDGVPLCNKKCTRYEGNFCLHCLYSISWLYK